VEPALLIIECAAGGFGVAVVVGGGEELEKRVAGAGGAMRKAGQARASGEGGRLPGPARRLLFRRRVKLVAKAGSSLKQAGLVEQPPQGQERDYGAGVTA